VVANGSVNEHHPVNELGTHKDRDRSGRTNHCSIAGVSEPHRGDFTSKSQHIDL